MTSPVDLDELERTLENRYERHLLRSLLTELRAARETIATLTRERDELREQMKGMIVDPLSVDADGWDERKAGE